MTGNRLGKIRRSQVTSTYGPGSIIDFRGGRKGRAAISAVAAGLEEWDRWSVKPGLNNDQTIHEPRLEKSLNVAGFRLPPVGTERRGKGKTEKWVDRLVPAVRFPNWLICPRCNNLREVRHWEEDPGDPGLYCTSCTRKDPDGNLVYVIPVRFVSACEDGHLDEFPWHAWVRHKPGCDRKKPLKLVAEGAGLRGLVLHCTTPGCGQRRSMEGIFSRAALENMGIQCRGRRPWLPSSEEHCEKHPRVIQRGASNIYYPATESALDIPPWSDSFQDALGNHWSALVSAATDDDVAKIIELVIHPFWDGEAMTLDEMKARIRKRLELIRAPASNNFRYEEYLQLTSGERTLQEHSEFAIHPGKIPQEFSGMTDHIVRVERLREVRALYGFTRINPPSGEHDDPAIAPLSMEPKNWLPAIEVRGEGIFIGLSDDRVSDWESQVGVIERSEIVNTNFAAEWKARFGDEEEPPFTISARLLLVHTLAHALMRQLSLECGYSTSALRERLYVAHEEPRMCGLLIYTSTSDADGTLGGLVRQGRAGRVRELLPAAVDSIRWCSSDPLCMKGLNSVTEGTNLAACHSCVLAPETACEHFNRFLDRAMVVGIPGEPNIGYFSGLQGG